MNKKDHIWTFNQILDRFEIIEKKLSLDKSIIKNVPWWDVLRYRLFKEILFKLDCREKKTLKKKLIGNNFILSKIFNFFLICFDFLKIFNLKSPIWVKNKSVIILGHPRRKLEDNYYIDPYSDPFIDLFPHNIDFSLIERKDFNGHLTPAKTKNIYYNDILNTIASVISKFRKFKFTKDEIKFLSLVEKTLAEEFYIKIDLKKQVREIIKKWLGIYPLMRLFFKIKKPKLLIIVVSAGHEAVILAAKSLNILTMELQHGTPSRGKLNYDYTSGIIKKTFPDYFLSFGDYWPSECKLSISSEKIIPFGYPYLINKLSKYSHIKKENRILIVSQSDLTRELSEFAKQISKKFNKNLIVEYKPHPYEFIDKEPEYFETLRNSGVIISNKNADIYEIFARSRWQVGVFSTALYEGLYFDVACYILNVNGSEHMKNLIDIKLASLISSTDDINFDFKVDQKKLKKIFTYPSKKNIDFIISLAK